jgi:hypothetical protein
MDTFEIVAQVRLMVTSDTATHAEDAATAILNEVVMDIEHIEVIA